MSLGGNWVEHTTTGGSGNLTLAAITGRPSFQSVWGSSGTRAVFYEVDDAANGQFESGVGSINLSTLVLTRTNLKNTFTGTTWNDKPSTALTFASTAIVRCAPLVQSLVPAVPAQTGSTYGANQFFKPDNLIGDAASRTLTTSTIFYTPILWLHSFPIANARAYIEATPTAGNLRCGLYSWGTDGGPDQLIADFGSFTTASTGAVDKAAATWASPTSSFALQPGWYWMAVAIDVGTVGVASWATVVSSQGAAFDRAIRFISRGTFTFGALASAASSNGSGSYTATSNVNAPAFWMGP